MNNINNIVAKHARKYNKAHVMVDRKKAEKRGKIKHKKSLSKQNFDNDYSQTKQASL